MTQNKASENVDKFVYMFYFLIFNFYFILGIDSSAFPSKPLVRWSFPNNTPEASYWEDFLSPWTWNERYIGKIIPNNWNINVRKMGQSCWFINNFFQIKRLQVDERIGKYLWFFFNEKYLILIFWYLGWKVVIFVCRKIHSIYETSRVLILNNSLPRKT